VIAVIGIDIGRTPSTSSAWMMWGSRAPDRERWQALALSDAIFL
jgi:hypothetical protein